MEEQLLKDMILDRDRRVSQIQKRIDRFAGKMEHLTSELSKLREVNGNDITNHRLEIADLLQEKQEADRRLLTCQRDLQQQGASLHLYADVVKRNGDSSYVIRMQAQLCKAIHSMGIVEHQLALVKTSSDAAVKALKDTINSTVEDKSHVELKLLNELVAVDTVRAGLQSKLDKHMEKDTAEKERLQGLLEELLEGKEEDEEDEEEEEEDEEDDEEEEERQLLIGIMKEREEEIKQLEEEIENQRENIEKARKRMQDEESKRILQLPENLNITRKEVPHVTTTFHEPVPDPANDEEFTLDTLRKNIENLARDLSPVNSSDDQ